MDKQSWSPPTAPDPQQIRNEARAAMAHGDNAGALARMHWFHEHALRWRRSLYGVRLSFALADWHALALRYPPAMAQLRATREQALSRSLADPDAPEAFERFHDFVSINQHLDEPERSSTAFAELDARGLRLAEQVYRLCQAALIRAGRFELCAKYLTDPARCIADATMAYKADKCRDAARPDTAAELRRYRDRALAQEAGQWVLILVRSGRNAEAEAVVKTARHALQEAGAEVSTLLDEVLQGRMPDGLLC